MARVNNGINVLSAQDPVPTDAQGGYAGGDSTAAKLLSVSAQSTQAVQSIDNLAVTATALPAGSAATATITGALPHKVVTIGVPRGEPGADGADGMGYAEGVALVSQNAGTLATAQAAQAAAASSATLAQQAQKASLEVPDNNVSALIGNPATGTRSTLTPLIGQIGRGNVGTETPLWTPPVQASAASIKSKSAAQMLTDWWEPLRDDNYVTRAQIGTDQTGTHPIYRYDFTPPSYDRTVLVSCNMHGGEKVAAYTLSEFARHLVNEWQSDPWLTWMRWNVRVVIVPSINPWGGTSANGSRVNGNGVDINRNWDYKWADNTEGESNPAYNKGPAPFSESETRALRDLALSLAAEGGLVGYLDCHDTGETVSGSQRDYYGYLPDHPLVRATHARRVIDGLYKPGETTNLHPSPIPMACNWMAAALGIRSATMEYEQRGTTGLSGENTTRALEMFGNMVMQTAVEPVSVTRSRPEPIVAEMSFSTSTTYVQVASSGAYTEMPELTAEFVCNGSGIAIFEGELTIGSAVATVDLRAAISQARGRKSLLTPSSLNDRRARLKATDDLSTVPFRVAMEVHEDPADATGWPVKIGLFGKASAAGVFVSRYTGTFTFLPAERPDRYRQMTATGRSGAGAMQQTYPA